MQHATILANAHTQHTLSVCRNETFMELERKPNLAYHWEKYILNMDKPELD